MKDLRLFDRGPFLRYRCCFFKVEVKLLRLKLIIFEGQGQGLLFDPMAFLNISAAFFRGGTFDRGQRPCFELGNAFLG